MLEHNSTDINNINDIQIVKMEHNYLDDVFAVECDSFSIPWTKDSLESEIFNETSHYYVAVDNRNKVIGYCGMWHIVNEGHITNIAVSPNYRNRGIGAALIERLIDLAYEKEMIGITLEVRINNPAAHALYAKYGFKPEGIRKNYYTDTKEDAIIMWKYL